MMDIIIQKLLDKGVMWEGHLKALPLLKNCENWMKVKPIGRVDHKLKYSHYKGAIVSYGGKLYFLTEATIDALSPYISWKFPGKIRIISTDEYRKLKNEIR
jgi:hypothetical protein